MMRRAAAIAAAAVLLWPSPSRAWTCVELLCPAWQGEIPVGVGPLSADLEAIAPGTTLAELDRAVSDWTLLPCADVPFGVPASTAAPLGALDGVSTVGFIDTGWPYDAAAIGITTIQTVAGCGGACIVEADTSFNAESFEWVTVRGSLPQVNAYSIALHELGHYIGLGHSNVDGAAMNLGYSRGYLTLSSDDEAGACELYPRAGTAPDCAVVGCPFGRECVNGLCVAAAAESCVTAMDCAYDERCIELTGLCVRQNVAVPGLGDPCSTNSDCESKECADLPEGRRCTLTCDGLDPRSCPNGFYCDPKLTNACGTGLCVAGEGGSGAFGSACTASTDCASLFCDRGVCSVPCDASATNNCPTGRTCHPDAETGCGACLPPLPTGEPCLVDAQCESSLCFAESADAVGWCTIPCADAADCPTGFTCDPAGAESLCFPPPPAPSDGCGCSAAGASRRTGPLGVLLLAIGIAAHARSRRRRR